ncbi:YbhB/YbcL family Raf kinase inhibitor-like protein [Patescibacteria group bacterium]|nr:YbhB/YbcL family Raf kinase inhibitor-like protein [Patescibacteria group bacterium]
MKIISPAFGHMTSMPAKYTCDGKNINPPLEFVDVPQEAKSLTLIMDDPDALKPAGRVWDHWLVWNMPSVTRVIAENTQPAGVVGPNTRGNHAYRGPCPPDGEHRYIFKLYALDVELDIDGESNKHELESAMSGHILAQAELIGLYNRENY